MTSLLDLIVWAHVAAGFTGLVAFWIPIVVRKGGRLHKQAGAVYAWCAYVVTLSAVVASGWRAASYAAQGLTIRDEPAAYGFALFLGYLGIATFAAVRQSIRAVQTRRNPTELRTPFHEGLAYAAITGSVMVIVYAVVFWSEASPILLALSPVGLSNGRGMLSLMREPDRERTGWFYSHLGSMLGGGIAFHTAFAVFGAQRLWSYSFDGLLGILPWILPALVGVPGIALATRYYRRRFTDGASSAVPT